MQFMPATWRSYGRGGDVHDPHDAILGAARFLAAAGARSDEAGALYRYNPSPLYVTAVSRYARRDAPRPARLLRPLRERRRRVAVSRPRGAGIRRLVAKGGMHVGRDLAAARVRGGSAVRLRRCCASPDRPHAKPPAPGAPGAIHTWAPADKHGFGTAHQLASKAWFTLRQGSLSEVYYPDLSTPGVPRAAVRRQRRQGAPPARDGRRRPAPHRAARARRDVARRAGCRGRSSFRQVTEGTRLAPDEDVDHGSGPRDRARAASASSR